MSTSSASAFSASQAQVAGLELGGGHTGRLEHGVVGVVLRPVAVQQAALGGQAVEQAKHVLERLFSIRNPGGNHGDNR